jgi:hypothetical protein
VLAAMLQLNETEYPLIFKEAIKRHREAAEGDSEEQWTLDPSLGDSGPALPRNLEPEVVAVYRSSMGGCLGWAFNRLFLWLEMQCMLAGRPSACLNWSFYPRKRASAWSVRSLTAPADVDLHWLLKVMKSKPEMLTMIGKTADRQVLAQELHSSASPQLRLSAIFRLGCTPLGMVVDPSLYKPEQLTSLWRGVLCLAAVRTGDVESARAVLAAVLQMMHAMGFSHDAKAAETLLESIADGRRKTRALMGPGMESIVQ